MSDVDGLPPLRRRWAAASIWLALTMAVLDATIANVALPSIARELHAAGAEAIWIVNAYQLAIVVSLLPLAALGEIISFRRVFQGGLVLFTAASLACAGAHTLVELALARALQGLGAAGVMSVNGALLRYTFPRERLGAAVGLSALVVSLASVAGPTLASGVLALAPWPWLFALNIPVGLAALGVGWKALPASPRRSGGLDWVAAGLNVMTFGLIITGVDVLTRGRLQAFGAGELALGALAAVLLVRRSIGQIRPLAPIDLMRSPLFSLSILTSIASFAAQMLALVSLPFLLQSLLGRSQVATGLLITPWPLAVGLAAPLAGRLSDHRPPALLSFAGLGVLSLGLTLLARLGQGAGTLAIAAPMAICGAGFGFFQSPNNRTLLSSVPLERSGAAGGMLATARLTGQTIGATAAAVIFRLGAEGPRTGLIVAAVFAGVAAFVSLSRLKAPPQSAPRPA